MLKKNKILLYGVLFVLQTIVYSEGISDDNSYCVADESKEGDYITNSILLDEIVCRIISDDGIIPVYLSDIWLPSALGVQTTLEERIIRMVWIARGADRGVKLQSDGSAQEYAEEYLDLLQKNRGVTRDELQKMCMSAGFTMRDIKRELNQQFLLQQSVETLLMASGSINVSAEEVKAFYDQNPTYLPVSYSYVEALCSQGEEEGVHLNTVNGGWGDKKTLSEELLPEHLKSLVYILVGDYIHYISDIDNACHVVHLIGKTTEKLIPLSERYEEIMRNLQKEKYIAQYKVFAINFLLDKEKVFFSDESYRDKCVEFVKAQEQGQ